MPLSTLASRHAGQPSKRISTTKMTKLTSSEESAIVHHILDLDSRGFPPTKAMLHDMANQLLEVYSGDPIGIRWLDNFLKHTLELKTW